MANKTIIIPGAATLLKGRSFYTYSKAFDFSSGSAAAITLADIEKYSDSDTLNIKAGDLVLDTNGQVALVSAVNATVAIVKSAVNLKGLQGADGKPGADGKGAANGTALTNESLNNYNTQNLCGWYYAGGGNTVTNKPDGVDAFGMWVLRTANGYYAQELYPANSKINTLFIRTYAGTTWTAWVEKGKTGATGATGPKGDKGDTGAQGPKGEKGDRGDTGATGPKGDKGDRGDKGATGAQGPQGPVGIGFRYYNGAFVANQKTLSKADSAKITNSSNVSLWDLLIDKNGLVTQIYAIADDGTLSLGLSGVAGIQYSLKGPQGDKGTNGTNGTDGITPSINSENKHWRIGTTDTGVVAQGQNGKDGTNGANGRGITSIEKTSSNGLTDTYTITYTDKTTSAFNVSNGAKGTDGTNGTNGITPSIGENGNWFLGTTDTGKPSRGANGANGTNGADGASRLTGKAAPAASLGKNGDVYIATDTYDLYTKADGAWSKIGNIKGAQGAQGAQGAKGDTGSVASISVTGDGNAITDIKLNSDKTVTATKTQLFSINGTTLILN